MSAKWIEQPIFSSQLTSSKDPIFGHKRIFQRNETLVHPKCCRDTIAQVQ